MLITWSIRAFSKTHLPLTNPGSHILICLWYADKGPTVDNRFLHYLWPILDAASHEELLEFIAPYFFTLADATRFMDGLLVGLEDDELTADTHIRYNAYFTLIGDHIKNFPFIRDALIGCLTRLIKAQYKILSKELCQESRDGRLIRVLAGFSVLAYVFISKLRPDRDINWMAFVSETFSYLTNMSMNIHGLPILETPEMMALICNAITTDDELRNSDICIRMS